MRFALTCSLAVFLAFAAAAASAPSPTMTAAAEKSHEAGWVIITVKYKGSRGNTSYVMRNECDNGQTYDKGMYWYKSGKVGDQTFHVGNATSCTAWVYELGDLAKTPVSNVLTYDPAALPAFNGYRN